MAVSRVEAYWDAMAEFYRRNFSAFSAEQLHIRTATPGEIATLKLNPIQVIVDQAWEQQAKEQGYVRLCVVKPRQPGLSTYSQARMFWKASLNKNFSVLLLALDEDNTRNIFEMSRFFYQHLEPSIAPLVRYSSKKELVFENPDDKTRSKYPGLGSRMQFQSSTRIQAGTGTTRHGIHISEASKFSPEATSFLEASLMPSLHRLPGTCAINEGTTFTKGYWFRQACDNARSGRSDWRCVFVPWYLHPEYQVALLPGEKIKLDKEERFIAKLAKAGQPDDRIPPWEVTPEQLKWRRLTIESSASEDREAIFNQEYPLTYEGAWVTFDTMVFNRQKLYEMRERLIDPIRYVEIMPDGKFLTTHTAHMTTERDYCAIWKEPERDHKYDIGVDTAIGVEGGDWSVAEVFDRDSHEQVAEYHTQKDGFGLADDIYWLGVKYNMAQIAIEMASSGYAVNGGIQRKGYPNLYIWRHRERSFPTLSSYTGWKTQRDSKQYMVTLMISWINEGLPTIHSRLLWNELFNFVRIPGMAEYTDQYTAGSGHDDAVMATGISWVVGDDESMGLVKSARTAGSGLSRAQEMELAVAAAIKDLHTDNSGGKDEHPIGVAALRESLKGWD